MNCQVSVPTVLTCFGGAQSTRRVRLGYMDSRVRCRPIGCPDSRQATPSQDHHHSLPRSIDRDWGQYSSRVGSPLNPWHVPVALPVGCLALQPPKPTMGVRPPIHLDALDRARRLRRPGWSPLSRPATASLAATRSGIPSLWPLRPRGQPASLPVPLPAPPPVLVAAQSGASCPCFRLPPCRVPRRRGATVSHLSPCYI